MSGPDDVLAEWELLAQDAREPLPDDAQMDAYYYGFNHTGVGLVDAVLSAVAVAGKGAHHTEWWTEEGEYGYYENCPGLDPNVPDGSAQDLIQRTAQRSAARVSAVIVALSAATAALRAVLDLHRPTNDDGAVYCGWSTERGTWHGCGQAWPCTTVRRITEALGGQG